VGEVPARGMQPGRRRLVAIKKLKDTADRDSVDALLQEFALLDQVKHRSIVRVFEYLPDENAVVMEYIHGVTLKQVQDELARAKERVFTEAAVEMGCEIADALYQAWTTPGDNGEPLRLVHRDLKPANIMLTATGEVKVLDWGLARVDNADFRRESPDRLRGTPLYMAPEQARLLAVDHRTDLFGLGLILAELLTGRPVYRVPEQSRDPVREVMAAIEKGDTRAFCAELESRLPAVGPLLTRSLQPRPEDRYQTGHDLLVDLRRQLYRDRGAYLEEFCEFFFGSVMDIGEPPPVDGPARGPSRSAAPRPSVPGGAPPKDGGRLSIEERLRQSIARDARARGPSAAPEPSPRGAAAPPPPPRPGAEMSNGRKPPPPPVGGGASRAAPFAPPHAAEPAGRKPVAVGQRRPDETGMLEMVPLQQNQDEVEVQGDPSATAFFAIPAPKAERARPAGPGGPIGVSAPPAMGAPPPPVPRAPIGAMGQPPPAAMPGPGMMPPPAPGPIGVGMPPVAGGGMVPGGFAQPGMAMPGMAQGPMIQGPVAGYGGGSPFQVAQAPAAVPSAEAGERVQSTRVFAVLFGVMFMVGTAILAAVWFKPSDDGDDDEKVASAAGPAVAAPVVSAPPPPPAEPDPLDAAPAPAPKPRRSSGGGGGGGSAAAAGDGGSRPASPAPSRGPGNVSVTITAGTATSVEVTCPSGVRQKVSVSGGRATVPGIPAESCTLFIKGGGVAAQHDGVRGGMSLTCSPSGSSANCR